eukprot:6320092-Prymnesium_polylepis.1
MHGLTPPGSTPVSRDGSRKTSGKESAAAADKSPHVARPLERAAPPPPADISRRKSGEATVLASVPSEAPE